MLGKLKNCLLILAVCSTIIENMGGIPLFICIAYFLVSLLDFAGFGTVSYSNEGKKISKLWVCLFVYLTIITGIFSSSKADYSIINLQWLKALVLFILVMKDTYNQPKLLFKMSVLYIITAFVCAVLMMNGIGTQFDPTEIGESRLTFLGTNANKMAMVYVYSFTFALFLLDYYIQRREKMFVIMPLLLMYMALCVFIMANMASRGAFVCILIELVYFFFFYRKTNSIWKNLLIVVLGLFFVVEGYEYISNISVFSKRMEMMAEGDYGQRNMLVSAAWNIFIDHPFFGVGLAEVMNLIGHQIGEAKTPHNLFLYILSAGGIIGFSLFMVIIYKTVVVVYKYGYRRKLLLPVLLMICILIDFAKNGGALTTAVNYVFFAIALNSCFFPNDITIFDIKSKIK